MKTNKSQNPWPLRLLSSNPILREGARLFNRKVISKTGVKIVSRGSLVVNREWLARLFHFQRLLNLVKDKSGDIVECGVASGHSLVALANLVNVEWHGESRNSEITRHIWGFDSFEGLPSPTPEDLGSSNSIARKGIFREAREETVLDNLKNSGLNESFIDQHVTLVKGWLHETLPKYTGDDIVLLHVDVDLYDSCKITLENLWPKVVTGGIVVFDEYHQSKEWPGEKKATDEYFSHCPGSMTMYQDPFSHRYYAIKTHASGKIS